MEYKLSRYAEKDLEQILTYTIENWGLRQFHIYRNLIEETLEKIVADRRILYIKKRDEVFQGCQSCHVGKHVIFFREKNNAVEILRILHQSMDVDAHFPE